MASTDAIPVPRKNVAYRLTFALYKNDGTLITGASGLDSEVSKDGGTFADCTNEATEIATNSGFYYLDLTSTEMNADCVAIMTKTSSTGAVIPTWVLYPQETGDIKVDVQSLLGTAWLTPGTAGTPDVNVKLWNGLTTVALPLVPTTAGRTLDVSAGGEAGMDWANVGSPTTSLNLSGTTISTSQVAASVTGNVGGNVTGSVGSVASGGISESSYATTAGSFNPLGIIDQGTAQSATGTTLVLRAAAAFASSELVGATIVITGGSAGVGQARVITAYNGGTDTATVDTWTTTPTGTITYKIFATAPGSSPTAAQIADQVWEEALSDHSGTSGSTAAALNAAGAAGDPWSTALPGAYGSGTAGKIIGDNINATISSRATQTSVDAVDDFVDTEVAAIYSRIGAPVGASISADIAAIQADTDNIQTRIPAALVSGRMDSSVGAMAANTMTAAAAAADLTTELQSGLATASAVSTLQTSVDDIPTNAELATALGTADDAVLARLGAPAGASIAADIAAVKVDTAAVKTKTDSLTFTTAGMVDAAIKRVGSTTLSAAGTGGQGYGA